MNERMERKRRLNDEGYEHIAGWLAPHQVQTPEARAVKRMIAETRKEMDDEFLEAPRQNRRSSARAGS